LKELIEDGVNGKFMDLSSESLGSILQSLIEDSDKLRKMAHCAIETAEQRFSMTLQAEKILLFYEILMKKNGG
ncbi:MAG: glycosyltransferase, partial [Deltaproteobacteria bacterium]|nr:glycosyltransferase [Deltaproteobacteria bacterium]